MPLALPESSGRVSLRRSPATTLRAVGSGHLHRFLNEPRGERDRGVGTVDRVRRQGGHGETEAARLQLRHERRSASSAGISTTRREELEITLETPDGLEARDVRDIPELTEQFEKADREPRRPRRRAAMTIARETDRAPGDVQRPRSRRLPDPLRRIDPERAALPRRLAAPARRRRTRDAARARRADGLRSPQAGRADRVSECGRRRPDRRGADHRRGAGRDVPTADWQLLDIYLQLVHQRGPAIAGIAAELADDSLPALVHCMAGKDRTGVVVALILRALDVPDEHVVADFARLGRAARRRFRARDDKSRLVEQGVPEPLIARHARGRAEHIAQRARRGARGVRRRRAVPARSTGSSRDELTALEAALVAPPGEA